MSESEWGGTPRERGGKACLTKVFLTVNTRESGENERGENESECE